MIREANRDSGAVSADRIRIVGLGNAGCGIVDTIVSLFPHGPATVAVNTDAEALAAATAPTRLQIGKDVTEGIGTGGDRETGREAAEHSLGPITELFSNTDLVFLVAGLGGGTGTGGIPVLARTAKQCGAMVLCFATVPFSFEGAGRKSLAEQGMKDTLEESDVVITVPNEGLTGTGTGKTRLEDAFGKTNETLATGIYAIWKLISTHGLINLDFASLRNLARMSGGACVLGHGRGMGEDRAAFAVEEALSCPLLGKKSITTSEAVMVSIAGDSGLTLNEIDSIMRAVNLKVKKGSHVFMGAVTDDDMDGDLVVTIVASERRQGTGRADAGGGRHGRSRKKDRKTDVTVTQADLNLVTPGKGRFKDAEPTIFDGEDLDVPTFIRRDIHIER